MNAPRANPYPGLRALEPDDNALFFGRERETDELRRRLRSARLLAVIGSSGSGKSSLVRSGLIPSLHSGFMAGAGSAWRVAIARPEVLGAAAEHADTRRTVLDVTLRDSSLGLAEAVRQAGLPAGENLLPVVDQFEELFRFRRRAPPDRPRRPARRQARDDAQRGARSSAIASNPVFPAVRPP